MTRHSDLTVSSGPDDDLDATAGNPRLGIALPLAAADQASGGNTIFHQRIGYCLRTLLGQDHVSGRAPRTVRVPEDFHLRGWPIARTCSSLPNDALRCAVELRRTLLEEHQVSWAAPEKSAPRDGEQKQERNESQDDLRSEVLTCCFVPLRVDILGSRRVGAAWMIWPS